MDKFSELKAAAMAATPGPWILDDDSWSEGDNANVSTEERYDGRIVSIAQIEGGGSESGFDEPFSAEQQANARYIAAANPAVVLALLAELEAANNREDGYRKKWVSELSNLQDAGKRIAELEGQLQSGFTPEALAQEERAESAEQRVAELEDKLATPVQLPDGTGWASDQYNHGRNNGIYECKEAIRAAGFTVEGDE